MSDSEAPDTLPDNEIPAGQPHDPLTPAQIDDAGLAALGNLIEAKLGTRLETFLQRQEKRDIALSELISKTLEQALVNHDQMNKLELRVEALETWKRAVELKLGI